jgi:hypothetical protein
MMKERFLLKQEISAFMAYLDGVPFAVTDEK